MRKLNEKEQAVFDYVCKISAKQGYAPSVRDICQALGYKSTSTVQMYLDRLLEYGYLCREAGKKRSLRPAEGWLPCGEVREIPIARRAVQGGLTEDCFEGTLPFFCGGAGVPKALFAFFMPQDGGEAEAGICYGVASSVERVSAGERAVLSNADGEILVAPWQESAEGCLLGKLIAVIHILQ